MPGESQLEDRLAVRERIEAYGDAVFRRDADDWIANWAEGAVWRLPDAEFAGKPQIKDAWMRAMQAFEVVGFFSMPGMIRVDGQHAAARVYTREVLVNRNGKLLKIMGAYDDQLTKTGADWLFSRRSYRNLHTEIAG